MIGNQYEISSRREQAKLAELQAQRDKAASLLAKEKEAREKAERELAKEKAAREKAEREQIEIDLGIRRESLKSDGWEEVGGSGLLYRRCNPPRNNSSLGKPCAQPAGLSDEFKKWSGHELYCLSEACNGLGNGLVALSFHSKERYPEEIISDYLSLKTGERHEFTAATKKNYGYSLLIQAAGFCRTKADDPWKKC